MEPTTLNPTEELTVEAIDEAVEKMEAATFEPTPGAPELEGIEVPTFTYDVPLEHGFTRKTLGQWYDAGIALFEIVRRPRSLPQAAQYKIARIREQLLFITEHVDREKMKLVQKYGEPNPQGNPTDWRLKPENKEAFAAEITTVTQPYADIKVRRLKLSELGTPADNNGIEAREFELLGDLVVDDVNGED